MSTKFKEQYQQEMNEVWEKVKGFQINELHVKGFADHDLFEQPITYFDVNGTGKLKDMIDNLFETCYLNPPHAMKLITPAGEIDIY